MKDRERKLLKLLQDRGSKIKECTYQYARYDAYGKNSIIELKERNTYYENTLIEFDKYAFNLEYAKQFGKIFAYVVKMENVVYVFNITHLVKKGYYFKWGWREMPKTTEFGNDEKIKKYVGFINTIDAIQTINL